MTAPFAVMPVLVGPLQVLLALLPAILAAVGGAVLAVFKPSGFKRLMRFFWYQKLFSACVILAGVALWHGYPQRLWSGSRTGREVSDEVRAASWPMLRGGLERSGWSSGDDPTEPRPVWSWTDHKTVLCSPTVAGDRIYFSTATDISPFDKMGRGAIVCVDAETGKEHWRYAGDARHPLRATFSSPAVAEERVVVGEGLHETTDARITCLDLTGRKVWEFRARDHIESTPCIHSGRVYVAAAEDGVYCFDLKPNADGTANIVWHLAGPNSEPPGDYRDCESSPLCDGETVWFGLGEEGTALVAVDAATGQERWRTPTPHPVFTAPTLSGGRLFLGVGNGNFAMSGEELRQQKIEELREAGRPPAEIEAAFQALAPYGAVWALDAATGDVAWKYEMKETVLDAIACRDGRLYFGARDGRFTCLSTDGTLIAQRDTGAAVLASAGVGRAHVYVVNNDGRLFCFKSDTLQPEWDIKLPSSDALAMPPAWSSSPTLARGHVYLGTNGAGLRCLGTTEPPEAEVWANGERGGLADDVPLPDRAEVAWTYSFVSGRSPAYLLPLGDSLYFAASVPEQDVKNATEIDLSKLHFQTRLFRLRCIHDMTDQPNLVWCFPASKHLDQYPLCGSGRHIVGFGGDGALDSHWAVECYDSQNGERIWEWSPPHVDGHVARDGEPHDADEWKPRQLTVDSARAYLWSGRDKLTSLDLRTGRIAWERSFSSPFYGTGALSAGHDVLYANSAREVVAIDGPSGKPLWASPIDRESDGLPAGGPYLSNGRLIFSRFAHVEARSPADGSLLWRCTIPEKNRSPDFSSVSVGPAHVVVGRSLTDFCVLPTLDGKEIPVRPFVHAAGDRAELLVASDRVLEVLRGRIVSHNVATGEQSDWIVSSELANPGGPPVAAGGRLYVACNGIVCLRGVQP